VPKSFEEVTEGYLPSAECAFPIPGKPVNRTSAVLELHLSG